jgi:hypothetical protein
VRNTETPDRSKLMLPGADIGRRPYLGPGASPFEAVHPVPSRQPASPQSPSRASALRGPP